MILSALNNAVKAVAISVFLESFVEASAASKYLAEKYSIDFIIQNIFCILY